MPVPTRFTVELNLVQLLADRATAHLIPDYEAEHAAAMLFIKNALHQHPKLAKQAAGKLAIAIADDQLARIQAQLHGDDALWTWAAEEVLHETLVGLGVWDAGKVLSPAFMTKLGLEDQ